MAVAPLPRVLRGGLLSLHSLRITLFYSLMAIPLHLVPGVIRAMLLNAKIRGQSVIRTVHYQPTMLPSTIANNDADDWEV